MNYANCTKMIQILQQIPVLIIIVQLYSLHMYITISVTLSDNF